MMLSGAVGVVWPSYGVFYNPSSSGAALRTSKRTPGEMGSVSHKTSKICCKNSVDVERNTDRHPRGPGCHPNCSLRWDLALNLWDRIYIRKTLTLSDPRHPQRTRDTSHMQAETGTARPGSRQLFLTRSPGVSSPHCHFLQALALLSLIVF